VDRFKLLDAGLKAFDASLPEVVPPLCLATRYRGSSCRLCLDVCPTAAITPANWLAVEPQRCTSCGACAAVCKTGALSYVARHGAVRKRLRGLAAEGARTVVLACRQAGADASATGADASATADAPATVAQKRIVVPCLGGLAAADLIAAAAFGLAAIELLSGDCAACADTVAGAAVEPTRAAAAETLLALGADVACTRRSALGGEAHVAAEAPAMSRAGLFSYVAQGLRRTAVEGIASDKRGVAELHRQAPPPVTRGWLRGDLARLASAAPALSGRSAGEARSPAESLPARLPLGVVAVSAACDGCGLCVRYCPHGSLALREGRLAVDRETCTGCGLCAEVCPPAALAVGPAPLPRRPTAGDVAPFRGVLL
jgi:ferredoxin